MQEKPVQHLVVDSSVLIRQAPIKDITDKAYIVDGAIHEIRDSATRQSLQVLPYDLVVKQPSAESLKYVSDFAKKTGDYTNLSAVDIQLVALTYELCKTYNDFKDLTKPDKPLDATQVKLDKPISIIGFYNPNKKQDEESENTEQEQQGDDEADVNNNEAENEASHEDNDGENDDDDEGWISTSNLKQNLSAFEESEASHLSGKNLKVACMTADFSMQNVLLQLGISIVSVDGLLLKKIRNYVLKCVACFKIATDLSKQFCPKCGNKTLERIVEVIDAYGEKTYIGRRKPKSTKGLRHPLPMPKGGKHSDTPILSEDQPRAQNYAPRKAYAKTNALDPDYVAYSSPFATRDVYSRAAHLGIKPNRNNMKTNKK